MTLTDILPQGGRAAPAVPAFLPREHGSWSLALEPLALGLLVAPSGAGLALAAAAMTGFFARRPLKASLTHALAGRRRAARGLLAAFSLLSVVGLGEAGVLGGLAALWPLLVAAPLAGLFLWFDRQGEARAAAAELAGSSMFAVLPAALATLAGWPAAAAAALAMIALGRSVPTVLAVRTCLRLIRGQPARRSLALLVGAGALVTLVVLAANGLVPRLAAAGPALLLLRTVWYATSYRPTWTPRHIGTIEAVLGLLCIGLVALAYRY